MREDRRHINTIRYAGMMRWRFYAVVAAVSAVTIAAAYALDAAADRVAEIISAAIR